MGITKLLSVAISLATPIPVNAQAPAFTQVIVFGDNLSDDGNIAHHARHLVGFSYPSSNFNYSDYRFTDDTNTSPAANLYVGTWHEQLEKTFLRLAVAKNSLDGGTDYAFGGAITKDGTQDLSRYHRQLSALGSQSSIGFPSGSFKRAKRPLG